MGAAKFGMSDVTGSALPFDAERTAAANGAITPTRSGWSAGSVAPWLFGIGAAALGLIAVSTSVRIGPIHLSGSI